MVSFSYEHSEKDAVKGRIDENWGNVSYKDMETMEMEKG